MVWFWVMFYTEWKTKDCFVKKHKIDNYKNKFQIVMAICTKSKTKCDNFIYDETYLENDVDELMNELKNEHPINSEIKCYYNWFLHEIELRKSAADDYSHLGTLMIIPIGIGFLLYLIIMDINGE